METQQELDFSTRGERLRLLSRVPLPKSRQKAVLQAIDDAIGKESSWCISLARIMNRTGLSKRTVQRAVDDLEAMEIIEVAHRFEVHGDRRLRKPSRFRILWWTLAELDPQLIEEPRRVQDVEQPRRCATGVTVTPGGVTMPGGGVTVTPGGVTMPGGGVTVTPGSGHHDHLPAQTPAPAAHNLLNPLPDVQGVKKSMERGNRLLWTKFTDDDLRNAVRSEVPILIQELYDEAATAGWLAPTEMTRQRFFAACHHIGSDRNVRSPKGALIARLKRRDWSKGSDASDRWASQATRAVDSARATV